MFSDVRNSEVRRASVCLSVCPTDLHQSPPVFSYFASDILDYLSSYSLLTCEVAQAADQLTAFLQNYHCIIRKRLAIIGINKSVGPDGIPGSILKMGGEASIP